jgi:4-alpha-glucanotransferase
MLISLEVLCDRGLLYPDELHELEGLSDYTVEFDHIIPIKMRLLERAASRFHNVASDEDKAAFETFSEECHFWVDEYAFFMALKECPRRRRLDPVGSGHCPTPARSHAGMARKACQPIFLPQVFTV